MSMAEDVISEKERGLDTLRNEDFFTLAELDSLIDLDFKDYRKIKKGEKSRFLDAKGSGIDFLSTKSSIDWEGPFTVWSEQTKIQDEVLILISDAPLLATGYYYCDVYLNRAEVDLPLNSVGRAEPKTIYVDGNFQDWAGYTDMQNFEIGINEYTTSSSTEKTLVITTYSIRVINSLDGRYIDRYLPEQIGNNLPFNYFYLEY
jgi:hypothetical protein|tara:strand:+ start:1134 stop:1742 length:609 start_codon:yes stop_codon:yes gene_type:complete